MASLRLLLAVSAIATALLLSSLAQAAVRLCVEARTEAKDVEGFRKLVLSEVARHPSHQVVQSNCQSRLLVESFRVSGMRYLTAQLDGEVPDRTVLGKDSELASRLTDSISQVLGNDPMHLAEDPTRLSGIERASRSVLVRGANTYRLELFEVMARTDQNLAFAPGIAIGFARGADQWQVLTRLHLAGSPEGVAGNERALRLATGMDLGVIWEASRRARTSAYVGAIVGVTVMRFAGQVDPQDTATMTDIHRWLPVVGIRTGLRLLRFFDFDADVFAQLNAPILPIRQVDDEDWGMNGTWTPSLQLGLAVGF